MSQSSITKTPKIQSKAVVIDNGGYYAVISYVDHKLVWHCTRLRSLHTAQKFADLRNAKLEG